MGLDIWFQEDLRNAILAANEASSATAEAATSQDARTLDLITEKLRGELSEDGQALLDALHAAAVGNVNTLKHYRRGYRAALITLALAFGLSPAIIDGHHHRDVVEAGTVLKIPAQSAALPRSALREEP